MSLKTNNFPFVTAMIVFKNEEKYIEKCLTSLFEQDYPQDRYEIILIDGESNDNSLAIAKKTEEKIKNGDLKKFPQVKYLNNDKKILAAGWNLGIKNATGEYVFRIDAHGHCDSDFISLSVKTILEISDAVCVGGTIITESLSNKGALIASVLSSPFGVGNSKFRYTTKAQYVDTVAFGLYKKKVFEEVGYFDETLKRNQDNDMHARIRKAGYKFYLNPLIKSTYHSRETVKGMMKQGFNNGFWNIVTFKKNPKTLSIRHLIPFLFLVSIMVLLIASIFHYHFLYVLSIEVLLHIILGYIFAIKYHNRRRDIIFIPILYLLLHLSYGIGSFISIIRGGKKK